MKRNKFSKALKHLKSKKRLDETAPTNSMSGVYQVNPSTGDAFRLGPKDPPKRFYPKADGTWPAGIPGNAGDIHYDRPAGYWNSGRNVVQPVGTPTERDYSYGDVTAKGATDTTTLIRASDGKVYTALPPNTESFILGPVVTSYAINHGYDDYTNLGYIQKDTRQFVLLARIQGFFKGEDRPRTSFGGGNARTWDGNASDLTIYNNNFTLEHALWMRETYLSGNFKANFPFNFAGGIPVDRHPDNSGMGGGDILGTDDGQQSDDGHTEGEEQDDPDDNDIDSLDLQGLIDKALLAIDVALMGLSILGILFPEPTTSAAGAAGLAALLAKLRRLRALKAAAKAAKGKFKFPKFPKPKTPKPKFPKPKTPKGKTKPFDPTKRPDGKPFTDPRTGKPIKPKTPVRPDGKPLDPLPTNKPTTKRPFTPGGSNTRPGSKRPFDIPKDFKPNKPAKVTTGSGKTPTPKSPKFKFKNPFKPKGKGLGGGADVGATGLKKPGFDALNPDQIGPTSIHKGSKGLLSPKGGGTYTAPKVGEVGPSPLKPGTGGARYTQFGSNPLNPQGGQGGGVIGSVVPKGARGLNIIEPQKVVNPKTFKKGSEMFNRIMKGAYPKSKAAERIRQKGLKAGFKPGSGSIEFKNLPNLNMDFDLDFGMYLIEEVLSDDEQNRRLEAMTQDPKFFENLDGIIDTLEDELEISKLFVMLFGDDDGDIQESVITESKTRILREIRQPLKEIQELPKTTKLKGYRPNFKGKYSPQNTPDVTASKQSDEAVHGYNTSRMAWTSKDKFWKGYETTERMNVIYDRVGFGQQYFDEISGENLRTKVKKKREVQEHLNQLAHEKAMREVYGVKEFQNKIDEAETYDNKVKDPLFAKVADRLKKEIDYSDKPSPHGYPTEPPAKIDPNTGMHPKYGKRYKYDKLDPVSAVMMKRAPTGDPEIDANVRKAAQERKEHAEINDQISEWMFGKLKRNWRKELDEGMTTANAISTILPAEGDVAIDQVSPVDAASFADVNNMFGAGADNPALDGTVIRANGTGSGSDGGFNVGGQYLAFQGTGSSGARMALLKPMDATKVDTITITAIRGNSTNGGEEADIAGAEELFVIYKTPDMTRSSYLSQDRNQNNIGSFPADAAIIAIGQGNGTLQNYTITIPDYARQKDVVFGLYQQSHSGSGYDHYGVTDIKFQRRTPLNVVVPLDSPEAVSFIRVGSNEGDPKKRKKRVDDMLKASDEYTAKQMGGEFPGQGNRIDTRDPFAPSPLTDPDASPIGKEAVTKSFKDFGRDASAPEADTEPTPADEIEAGKPLSDFHSDADPSKTTEPEPEVEAEPKDPSAQAAVIPKDENGEDIEVKDIGDKAIQGVDAAKLEAETETEPEAEVEPEIEPTSVDEPEPEPEDEEEKKNWLQRQIEKHGKFFMDWFKEMEYSGFDVAGSGNIFDLAQGIFATFASGTLEWFKIIAPRFYKDSDWGKMHNNITIARAVVSGKVVNHVPLQHEIADFRNRIDLSVFKDSSRMYIPISSQRHEYADKNIYVLDGKVYNNRKEGNTDLTVNKYGQGMNFGPVNASGDPTGGLGGHGTGYAQLIIPEDGGKPYVHYYDYNYHNLKNPDDLPIGGAGRAVTGFASDMAHLFGLLNKIPGMHDPALRAQKAFEEKFNNLGNEESFIGEGWPPGIHGAALTDFKIYVDDLSEDVQSYIANHPLSWTDARVSQMSNEFLEQQFAKLIATEGVKYKFETEQDIDNFFKGVIRIMNQKGLVINPKFKEGFIGFDKTWNEIQDAEEQRKAIVNSKEYDLARLKAEEDYQKLWDDYQKAITREELHKNLSKGVKIPDPKTDGEDRPDWSEWINGDKKEYDNFIAQQDKYLDAAKQYWTGTHKKISNRFFSYQDSLPREGDKIVGTDEQIAKLNRLYNEYQRSSDKHDALYAKQDEPMKKAGDLLNKFIEDYDRRMAIWEPYLKELDSVFAEVDTLYKSLIDETYIAYQNTVNPIEGTEDGIPQYVNGGDYTDRDGKVYKGMGTLTKDIDESLEQLNIDLDKYAEMQGNYGFRYLMGTLSQFIVRKPFGGKTPDWSPEKTGTGAGTGGGDTNTKPKPKPSDRSYFAGLDEPVFFGGSQKKNNKKGGGAMTASRKMEGTPLFEKLKQKQFFNPKDIKPTFPPNDPPEIDPKTKMHANYGKQAGRYKKLDPMSANAMPATGDPEIDAVVDKQRTDKTPEQKKKDYIKTASTIKKLAKKR